MRRPQDILESALHWGPLGESERDVAERCVRALRVHGYLLISRPEKTEVGEPMGYGSLSMGRRLRMRGVADGQVLTSQQLLHPAQLDRGDAVVDHVWQYVGREYAHELGQILGCFS